MASARITFSERGDWKNTTAYLDSLEKKDLGKILERYGTMGVNALANATPKDTGITSERWRYEIVSRKGYYSLRFHNDHRKDGGPPIAILIQYGHGTKNGGYVQPIDYVNPAMAKIFDQIANDLWREVS